MSVLFTILHSPVIYGNWVETYGPYSQDYMRLVFWFHVYLNNGCSWCQRIYRTIYEVVVL